MKLTLFRTDDTGMPAIVPNTVHDLSAHEISECGDELTVKFDAVDYPRRVTHIGKLLFNGDWDVFPLNREQTIQAGDVLSVSISL